MRSVLLLPLMQCCMELIGPPPKVHTAGGGVVLDGALTRTS